MENTENSVNIENTVNTENLREFDVVIIGGGPAGLAAAIYAKRAEMSVLVLEKAPMQGGQIINTYEVDNYPGLNGLSGFELATKFKEHCDSFGVEFLTAEVERAVLDAERKELVTNQGTFYARAVILATGAEEKKLMVPGEKQFTGAGVSYCATCDGAFFRKKTVAVVGGGNVALEDAIFLARLCEKVYLIHRRDTFRAARNLQTAVRKTEKIECLMEHTVISIQGEQRVSSVLLMDEKEKKEKQLEVNGVFVAVGTTPNTKVWSDSGVAVDENGYIIAGEDTKTNLAGVFAAGDVRTKELRQVITAAADGACAITSAEKYFHS